ncbi:sigma-70 family RNA polymerase sigma factor, partial [Aliishimia ponticola]|uniref:sigma-70 family RNA polymerase sigma factor n=1 Tax=Aliishimia ponticola TaxID=2499833 RepID=UPI001456064A
TCFLHESVAEDFVARPKPYLNRRLLTRFRDGDRSVFLFPQEQAPRNAGAGLEMFVLEYCQETFDFESSLAHQILNAIIPVYIAAHTGFNVKRCLHETELSVGHIQESGGNPFLFEVDPQDPFSLSEAGHGPRGVYGVSRDSLIPDQATGIAKSLLFCQAPKFQLVLQEQALVRHALEGFTDVEIARAMDVSRDRVKQIWQRIYAHLEDIVPEFFSSVASPVEGLKRGGEKRRVSVAYLRSHPEELRPRVLRRV